MRNLVLCQAEVISIKKCSFVETCAVGWLLLVLACQFIQLPVSIKSGLQRCHWILVESRGSCAGDGTGVLRCLD